MNAWIVNATFCTCVTLRLRCKQEMADMPEVGIVRFHRVFEIRWLSLGNIVAALIRNYQPLMAVLEECAVTGDPTASHHKIIQIWFTDLLRLWYGLQWFTGLHLLKNICCVWQDFACSCKRSTLCTSWTSLEMYSRRRTPSTAISREKVSTSAVFVTWYVLYYFLCPFAMNASTHEC